jgi:hypothetical protein
MSKLLIDDKPVMVLPKLAVEIGLNEAVVLQQIHYWLETYREANKQDHFNEGKWWVYNTKQEWQANFPWWSENTVWRALTALRDRGLVITTSKYNKKGYDKTLWYTIDYDKLEQIEKAPESRPCTQNGKMDVPKMVSPIPETTTETLKHGEEKTSPNDDFIKELQERKSKKKYPQMGGNLPDKGLGIVGAAVEFAKQNGNHVRDYPPDVQEVVSAFHEVFKIPIPAKTAGTDFKKWIKFGRQYSKRLAGLSAKEVFQSVKRASKEVGWNIADIQSIQNNLGAAMAEAIPETEHYKASDGNTYNTKGEVVG